MIELEYILANYREIKEKYSRVPRNTEIPRLVKTVRQDIADIFRNCIESYGYKLEDWKVKGSIGEPNRSFANVPWVALFKRSITTSAENGYYIVLLFSEDMSSVYLTLNQGYTAFKERYSSKTLAYKKLKDCAREVISFIGDTSSGFIPGEIDLHTTAELPLGYQMGSIWAKQYHVGALPNKKEFEQDVHTLLRVYSLLWNKFPQSLVDLEISLSNDEFAETVAEKIKTVSITIPTQGPQPIPQKGKSSGKHTYIRSADVSARALARAGGICALSAPNEPHRSFIWKKTGANYVEAHHLIPFSKQAGYPYSLDVEENIVALCPNCHRLLHHAQAEAKYHSLKRLLHERKDALAQRELIIELKDLRRLYDKLEEKD